MDNFYVTLTSNKELSNFKTTLASRIELHDEWEVGLSTFSFTNSSYNFNEEEFIEYTFYDSFNLKKKVFKKPVVISVNNYFDINSLLADIDVSRTKVMNSLRLEDASIDLPEFELNKKQNKLSCNLKLYNNFLVFPQMSERLCKLLGFNKELLDKKISFIYQFYEKELKKNQKYSHKHSAKDKVLHAESIYNLKIDKSMFLYCDVVKESYVNEHLQPLLRYIVIPYSASYGDQIVLNYPICNYIPVRYNEFETIEITLKDENGKNFPFQSGNIGVVLHFRKQ